jgi:DGQHR domain-containing protein
MAKSLRKGKSPKKTPRKKLTSDDIAKNNYRKEVRSIFLKSGFSRIPNISDKEFIFQQIHKSDFDDVFVFENIVVFIEYTLTQSKNISSHLKPKKILYDAITNDKDNFLEFMMSEFPSLKEGIKPIYRSSHIRIIILYCSKYDVDSVYKEQVSNIKFLDYPILRYFRAITDAVKHSARFEIFKFFDLQFNEVGENVLKSKIAKTEIAGTILPEAHSNFKKGFKVVSFYIDPDTLLTYSYVLRKEGWRDEDEVYQRMIINSKINAIRKYLLKEERVFINNIIVTLPHQTRIKNSDGNTVDSKLLQETIPVTIEIPDAYNTIGLIDGQHRVFAYHEGGEKDIEIGALRKKQNLLVTGIIYPKSIEDKEKIKFEAKLFLEINANQTNAKSDLKQSIGLILNPFSAESIAKSLINKLNNNGPLSNRFERHFYEKEKIKTTSIVSYGLRPIMKLSGTDSFFHIWDQPDKNELANRKNDDLLKEYLNFALSHLNNFFRAIKENIDEDRWTTDPKVSNKVLSTTTINGLIIAYRKVIEAGTIYSFEELKLKLNGVNTFSFSKYKSSQYGTMGIDIFKKYFK